MIFEILSPYDLPVYFARKNSLILDIREEEEYNKVHIPTAKHYSDFTDDGNKVISTELVKNYSDVIVYCQHGTSSIDTGIDLCRRINKESKEDRVGKIYSLYGGISNYGGIKIEKR